MLCGTGTLMGSDMRTLLPAHDTAITFREALENQAEAKRAEWNELQHERRRLEQRVAELRRYIDSLNPILQAEGIDAVELDPVRQVRHSVGQRSGSGANRREAYTNMALGDVVEEVLSDGKEYHADELVRIIFDIHSPEEFRAAKANLGSTLSRSAAAGRWDRVPNKGNTFRAKQKELAMP
jgi:hypothetical protein